MPSKLATTTMNYLSGLGQVRQKLSAVGKALAQGAQTIQIRGPFSGLVPDVDANLIDGTSFSQLQNCLARSRGEDHGEVLSLPDGYRQVDAPRLPLGDATPPAAATGTPVVRLDQFTRFAPTGHGTPGEFTGEFIATPMAVTAGDGTTPATGFLYRIAASGQWTIVNPSAAMKAATLQLSAGRDGRSVSKSMGHSCTAPFGATARVDRNTADPANDKQTGAINEPCWIYTNDVNNVMVFPSSTVSTLAATHAYEPLVDAVNSGGRLANFKCKSVATWNGRVYFLNTSEAGTRRQQRLRRTAKFTADPEDTLPGAGFYDFRDFQGEGLRIEPLGDVLAVYFSDGVAFVRPTGNPTSPDEPQVLATERGLLGTHALCAIGRNVHFGVFTDGWWMIDQSGRWQEVGLTQLNNKSVPKWRETFFDLLSTAEKQRLYCYYDQPSNLVYVALPTKEEPSPKQVWIYDPVSDRVFLENYSVTCFGTFTPLSQSGTTINSLSGTIDDLTGTIDSYGPVVGFPKVRVHGDEMGFVYKHDSMLEGYDPPVIAGAVTPIVQEPTWSFTMGLRSPTGMRNLVTIDRVSLEYFNHGNHAPVSVEVAGPATDGSQTRSVVLDRGGSEELKYRDAWFRYTSTAPGLTVSGTGGYHLRSFEIDLMADPLEPRGT